MKVKNARYENMLITYGKRLDITGTNEKCKHCNHFMRVQAGNRTVFKCKVAGVTSSHVSDWRANWLACGMFGIPIEKEYEHNKITATWLDMIEPVGGEKW